MLVTTAVTPFVLEYGAEHPAVYALELLPLYDGIARVKSQAHWQTDVLASLASGDLKGKRIGTQWRVTRAAVDAFLTS